MYVPAQPAQPAIAFAPPGTVSAALSPTTSPFVGTRNTRLSVRSATLNVLSGHPATVTGTLTPALIGHAADLRSEALSGRMVMLQAAGRHGWSTIARARTGTHGRFRLRYIARATGSDRVRLRFAGDTYDRAARRSLGHLNVYRLAEASWYGGGGNTACGGTLTSTTMGVANKTLPCGTLVTLRYDGHSVRVPVVDRGPFVAGREFDLTEATKQALGFGGVGEVWSTR
jgi:rare lipoprotein A